MSGELDGEPPTRGVAGERLTTWALSPDGRRVRLGFAQASGAASHLDFPVEVLSGLLLTLPCILERALALRGETDARIAHPLSSWKVEQATEHNRLILSLSTTDGFGVAFTLRPGELAEMGRAAELALPVPRSRLN
ncbi:hypothetical protein EAH89_21550 [Roseomonas nepalensis]|uniref:Uncharacterized protein n=1 Tax=Muricoccus nepalensis TaxID=1854500 RepID=A0A502FIH2_9PROT|nr:hypothetical protein [Roseomonas nepalensis]TPG49297.1 hypothetical protein EAH89_21550 [Roseomonas nepalensis]